MKESPPIGVWSPFPPYFCSCCVDFDVFCSILFFLEGRYVRQYQMQERAALLSPSADQVAAYLDQVGYPYGSVETKVREGHFEELLVFLAGRAVALLFEDLGDSVHKGSLVGSSGRPMEEEEEEEEEENGEEEEEVYHELCRLLDLSPDEAADEVRVLSRLRRVYAMHPPPVAGSTTSGHEGRKEEEEGLSREACEELLTRQVFHFRSFLFHF